MPNRLTLEEMQALQRKMDRSRASSKTPSATSPQTSPESATASSSTSASQPGSTSSRSRKSLRQRTGPLLNDVELRFQQYLTGIYGSHVKVGAQNVTLELANGVRYTPDFNDLGCNQVAPKFYEVKAKKRKDGRWFEDDARVKLKVAARLYPRCSFFLVFPDPEAPEGWRLERVLP